MILFLIPFSFRDRKEIENFHSTENICYANFPQVAFFRAVQKLIEEDLKIKKYQLTIYPKRLLAEQKVPGSFS